MKIISGITNHIKRCDIISHSRLYALNEYSYTQSGQAVKLEYQMKSTMGFGAWYVHP